MSFFVTCTFDLKNASFEDYKAAYADLASLGLSHVVPSVQGKRIQLPTTTVAGEYNGGNAAEVRDAVASRIKAAFAERRLVSEIFVSVGDGWAWSHSTT
jgi:hypothetical protein